MLVELATVEPGENWIDETFGWTPTDPIPGWELNVGWLKDETFPTKGFLQLRYSSDTSDGCAPNWEVRNELMKRVLVGEDNWRDRCRVSAPDSGLDVEEEDIDLTY